MPHNARVLIVMMIVLPLSGGAGDLGREPIPQITPAMVAADSVAEEFVQALRESQWSKALGYCAPEIQNEAQKYSSPATFFRAVVPLQQILRESRLRVAVWWEQKGHTLPGSWVTRDHDVLVARFQGDPLLWLTNDPIYWRWGVRKINEMEWMITFPVITLKAYVEKETAHLKQQQDKEFFREKELDPKLEGVYTRLTISRRKFNVGEDIPFRLELINNGPAELHYNDLGTDRAMTVENDDGGTIPDSMGVLGQTCPDLPKPIEPGKTVVLQDWAILNTRYKLPRPGRYTVQFSGSLSLSLKATKKNPWGVDTGRLFPSNVVEIEVVATQPE